MVGKADSSLQSGRLLKTCVGAEAAKINSVQELPNGQELPNMKSENDNSDNEKKDKERSEIESEKSGNNAQEVRILDEEAKVEESKVRVRYLR